MSDDDWGDGSGEEKETDEDFFERSKGNTNVWEKSGVGLNTEQVNQKVVKKEKKVDTSKMVSSFQDAFSENLSNVNAALYNKMATSSKQNTIVPTHWLFEKFKEDEDFYSELKLERTDFEKLGKLPFVTSEKNSFAFSSLWKYKYKKSVKQKKFMNLGVYSLKQANQKIDFMKNNSTQMNYGSHFWDQCHFYSLKVPMSKDYSMFFIYPSKKGVDHFKKVEKIVFKRDFNTVRLLNKEQALVKMEHVMIPKLVVNKKIDFSTYLKRLKIDFSSKVVCNTKVEFKSKGVKEPVDAPQKHKETYIFFKSEMGRPIHNVDEFPFVLNCPFLFMLVKDKNEGIILSGKIVSSK